MLAKLIHHDNVVRDELEAGTTFLIDTTINYLTDIDKVSIIEGNSLFSYKFEIKDGYPDDILKKRYSCKCGKIVGQSNEGAVCFTCRTKVRKVKPPMVAYMSLKGRKILNIMGMMWLEKVISQKNFQMLLDGKLPHIDDAYEHFQTMLDHYKKSNKPTHKAYKMAEYMKLHKEYFFTSYIPVITSKVRYLSLTKNMGVTQIDLNDLNKPYTMISTTIDLLNKSESENAPERTRTLISNVQKYFWDLTGVLISNFGGSKRKMLRDAIFGTRVPYTSIAILVPLSEYPELNSCTIPIETFRTTFKPELKRLMSERGIPLMKTNRLLNPDNKMTDEDKDLFRLLFRDIKKPFIYVNRQPTIDYESTQMIRIRDIRDELVIRLHPNLFSGFRGDCDGDTPSMFGIIEAVRDAYNKAMRPTNFIITSEKKFNRRYSPIGDFQILLTHAMREG